MAGLRRGPSGAFPCNCHVGVALSTEAAAISNKWLSNDRLRTGLNRAVLARRSRVVRDQRTSWNVCTSGHHQPPLDVVLILLLRVTGIIVNINAISYAFRKCQFALGIVSIDHLASERRVDSVSLDQSVRAV